MLDRVRGSGSASGENRARRTKPVCLVGVGAAGAGGIEAASALLAGLTAGTGLALVLVLGTGNESRSQAEIVERLARAAPLPVGPVAPGAPIEPGHAYVAPPGAAVTCAEGRLRVEPRSASGPSLPIDAFFRSLARALRSRAVGVILAGAGSDGALGIQAIHAAGGITLVQDAQSAGIDAAPLAAMGTVRVDHVLPPVRMAAELTALAARLGAAYRKALATPEADQQLVRILSALRAVHDVDLTLYRRATVERRVRRRMILNDVPTLGDYLALLRKRPSEVEALQQDIIARACQFFRDPGGLEAAARQLLPALAAGRRATPDPLAGDDGEPPPTLRIWVPGCATGEEVYSLAITLLEALGEPWGPAPFRIFGTDLSRAALETARAGTYLENIAADVPAARLRRFFTRVGQGFQIVEAVRNRCVFAQHDLTCDPPFSRLDLVSCRDVLVHLDPSARPGILRRFHYALNPAGQLLLGAGETAGRRSELFAAVKEEAGLYARNAANAALALPAGAARPAPGGRRSHRPGRPRDGQAARAEALRAAQEEADRVVLSRYAPPGVILDADLTIVRFRGQTGAYLEPAPGEASLDVLKMARAGLGPELRAAIHEARRTGAAVTVDGIRLAEGSRTRVVGVEVHPLAPGLSEALDDRAEGLPVAGARAGERWFLVLFTEPGAREGDGGAGARTRAGRPRADEGRVAQLERELTSTKEHLQLTIEEQEATNEELQSANEELLSSNEELQSINEELETAREEQEATTEELLALNAELRRRNAELDRAGVDLGNLLAGADLPIVMVGGDLRIRRFSPAATRVLNLIPGDVGRPLGDLNPRLDAPDLERLLTEAITSATARERRARHRDGTWYSLRIRPHRAGDDQVDGAVLVLVDEGARDPAAAEGRAPPGG